MSQKVILFIFCIICFKTSFSQDHPILKDSLEYEFSCFLSENASVLPVFKNEIVGFRRINQDHPFDWFKSKSILKINTKYHENCLIKKLHSPYQSNYQTFYLIGTVVLPGCNKNFLVANRIHNDNEGYMFIITVNGKGEIIGTFLVAEIFKHIDESMEKYSKVDDSRISTFKINTIFEESGIIKDSVTTVYNRKNYVDYIVIDKDSTSYIKSN